MRCPLLTLTCSPVVIVLFLLVSASIVSVVKSEVTPSTATNHTIPHPSGDWLITIRHWKGTIAAIFPTLSSTFSFASNDTVGNYCTEPHHHSLADVTLQVWSKEERSWKQYSTVDAFENNSAILLPSSESSLPAFDVTPLLNPGHGLTLIKSYSLSPLSTSPPSTALTLTLSIRNNASAPVTVGHVGLTSSFSSNWNDLDLNAAAASCSLAEPHISGQHAWVKVTRLTGDGRVLLMTASDLEGEGEGEGEGEEEEEKSVTAIGRSGMTAWRQLKGEDATPTGYAFEGHYEWTAISAAWQQQWQQQQSWVDPSQGRELILQPGEESIFRWNFQMIDSVRDLDHALMQQGNATVTAVPGYIVAMDMTSAKLFVHAPATTPSISFLMSGTGSMQLTRSGNSTSAPSYTAYDLQPLQPGRVRVAIQFSTSPSAAPSSIEYVNYLILPALDSHLTSVGSFTAANQFLYPSSSSSFSSESEDPFGRSYSVMPYDFEAKKMIDQDDRSYVVGLSDEAGAGPGLALMMKNRFMPNQSELELLDLYINRTLWGLKGDDNDDQSVPYPTSVQNANYSVRASMFWYPGMEGYNYSVSGGWDQDRSSQLWRSYNYVHPIVLYHSMYRVCRDYDLLPRLYSSCSWYLSQAYQTFLAMFANAPYYTQFGLMEGSVFLDLMNDLMLEGLISEYKRVAALQLQRVQAWDALPFPFGSEMPWDSTGQEEIWLSAQAFSFFSLSNRSLSAILAYSHAVPNWAYHGSARRFWDFWINGKPSYTQPWPERNLHHYGSSLNGKPLLRAYENDPDDVYLLEVGIGSMTGVLSNIQIGGATSMGFHADNAWLKHDPFDADYGCALYGHATSSSSYLVQHPTLGPSCYLCNLASSSSSSSNSNSNSFSLEPADSLHRRVYLEPIGTSIEVEVGRITQLTLDLTAHTIHVSLAGNAGMFSQHRLRFVHWASCEKRGGCDLKVVSPLVKEVRGAWTFDATDQEAQVVLSWTDDATVTIQG